MSIFRTHIFSLSILIAFPAFAQQPAEYDIRYLYWFELPDLKTGGDLNASIPWQSVLSEKVSNPDYCAFEVLIDTEGRVRHAQPDSGSRPDCESPPERLLEAEFVPVKRWWRTQWARFEYFITTRPADYAGPQQRTFPEEFDLEDVLITMLRTECYGTCPAYSVQIRGDGTVSYDGVAHVAVSGHQYAEASTEDMPALLDLFEQVDFFRLPAAFEACITDHASVYISLEIGPIKKTLKDYVGDRVAETCGRGTNMPPIISRIENEIDRVAGTSRWTGK